MALVCELDLTTLFAVPSMLPPSMVMSLLLQPVQLHSLCPCVTCVRLVERGEGVLFDAKPFTPFPFQTLRCEEIRHTGIQRSEHGTHARPVEAFVRRLGVRTRDIHVEVHIHWPRMTRRPGPGMARPAWGARGRG